MPAASSGYWRVLLCSLVSLGGGAAMLPDLWTTQASLTAFRGPVRRCNAYMETAAEPSRGSSGRKAYLVCYLSGSTREFALRTPLDESDGVPPAYELLQAQLERADSAAFWVRTGDTASDAPKVFRIDADGETVLTMETVAGEHRETAAVLIVLGLLGTGFASWYLLPGLRRRIGL